jgi:two-component system sensor histidine kinase SenX3
LEIGEGVVLFLTDATDEQRGLRLRRQFVAHASHELKSPVAAIQALGEAIGEAAADDPEAVEHLSKRLVFETTRLGRLVADLLDLSRVEDPASIASNPVNLSEIADSEIAAGRTDAEAREIVLRSDVTPDVWVAGDQRQLSLLVRNLLDNAIRYTPEGGNVTIDLRTSRDEAVVVVSDDGIGIPLKAQARVFERFFRVDEARSREHGGTGLGLAIVKHVADLHGGHVGVESVLGDGSKFTARIPLLSSRRPLVEEEV